MLSTHVAMAFSSHRQLVHRRNGTSHENSRSRRTGWQMPVHKGATSRVISRVDGGPNSDQTDTGDSCRTPVCSFASPACCPVGAATDGDEITPSVASLASETIPAVCEVRCSFSAASAREFRAASIANDGPRMDRRAELPNEATCARDQHLHETCIDETWAAAAINVGNLRRRRLMTVSMMRRHAQRRRQPVVCM